MRAHDATRILALLLALLLAGPALCQDKDKDREQLQITFNFKNADLDLVLTALSKTLKMTFIKETTVEGKLTAVSDRPIKRNRAIAFLNSALIRYNVAAVEIGDIVKIVTLEDAKRLNHSIRYGSDPDKLTLGDNIITQVIPLQYLDANQVKKELNDLTSKTGQFLLNTRANVILLTDTESNVKRFLTIIKQLDQAVQEVLKVKLYRLKYAGATELAAAIDQLFAPLQSPQTASKSKSRGGRGGWMNRIRQMWGGSGGSGGGAAGASLASQVVRTTVEERTNTLIVTASENTLKQIDKLIEDLDKPVSELLVIRLYPLANANAADVAKIIEQLFEGQSSQKQQQGNNRGRGGRWQRVMQMMSQANAKKGSSSPQQTIKVTSDERTNAVIVAASKENQELIRSLVQGLDNQVLPDQEVRIYVLDNADAEELKSTLEEVFDLEQQSSGNNRNQGGRGMFQQRGGRNQQRGGRQGGGRQGKAGLQNTDKVRVSADKRTNSLIVTANATDFGSIEKVIKKLDANNADNESTLVIKLQNAQAAELRTILNNLFGGATTNNAAQGGGRNQRGGNRRTQTTSTSTTAKVGALTGQVNVQADAGSNSLIFVTASRNFETIKHLVAELDGERPQVLIRAYIVEVDLDSTTEMGTEFTFTDIKKEGEGLPAGEKTSTFSSDFDVPERTPGAFQYRHVRKDFEVLLRALRKDGRLHVLSAPRILVQDTESASINIGQEVPFVTNTRLTNQGTTLNTIQYRDVGIILRVTPTISPKGLVKMLVEPEVSEIAPESQAVQITEGVSSPVFIKNTASTTITVRDGQTIVLGGMIMDRTRESSSKIPILGDIPLIGFLFSSTITEVKKVELMIFITPYVINQADELQDVTAFEIANLRLIDAKPILRRSIPKLPIDLLDD